MGRPLSPAEAASALRRGATIEQFVELAEGRVTYLSAWASSGGFVLCRHVVRDEGSDTFRDLGEFRPVDPDEPVGEGVVVARSEDAHEAVRAAAAHGGAADAWMNAGLASDAWWRAKTARSGRHPEDPSGRTDPLM